MNTPELITHPITFYFSGDFPFDATRADRYLPQYVRDANTILRRSGCVRRLAMDPVFGWGRGEWKFVDSDTSQLPREFDVDAYVVPKALGKTPGDMTGPKGGADLVFLGWEQILDPFDPATLRDYWLQLITLLHELGHQLGLCVGVELYDLMGRLDSPITTGPRKNFEALGLAEPVSAFWRQRPRLRLDPMGLIAYDLPGVPESKTREWLLRNQLFAPQHAAIMNAHYRSPNPRVPAIRAIRCMFDCEVWLVPADLNREWRSYGAFGPDVVLWPEEANIAAMCFKTPFAGGYVSIFDCQAAALAGQSEIVVGIEGSDVVIRNAPQSTLPQFPEEPDDVEPGPVPPVTVTMSRRLELSVGPTVPGRQYRIRSALNVAGPYREWMTVTAQGERIVLQVEGLGQHEFFSVEVVG